MGNCQHVECLARFNSTPGRGSTPVQLYPCKVLRTGPNGTLSAYSWRPSLRGTNVTDGLHATLRIAIGEVFPPRSKTFRTRATGTMPPQEDSLPWLRCTSFGVYGTPTYETHHVVPNSSPPPIVGTCTGR